MYPVSVAIFEEYEADLDADWLTAVAQTALSVEGVADGVSASVAIADDATVAELNAQHRGLDGTTDVLSFSPTHSGAYYGDDADSHPSSPAFAGAGSDLPPSRGKGFDDEDEGEFEFILPPDYADANIGEVIISLPQARRQAEEAGHSLENEIAALLAHGIYHLLGYDHEVEEDAERMRPRERAAMVAMRDAGLIS